jgi:tetratricopeptide (TPR) repeat protein
VKLLTYALLIFTLFSSCSSKLNLPEATEEAGPSTSQEHEKIEQAIYYHDRGKLDHAIEIYKEVLAANPENLAALYELSYSLFVKQQYDSSLAYALRGLGYKSGLLAQFFILAGNNLDMMGNVEDAMRVYEKGLTTFPDNYLLHYNLAVTQLHSGRAPESSISLQKAIRLNPNHASSHLALAEILINEGRQIPALLTLCRFLILEPGTDRSQTALSYLEHAMNMGISRDGEKNINVNIFILIDVGKKSAQILKP